MEHKMDLQVGLSGPPPGALFSISRDQSDRRATPNSDHQSAIASPSNTEIALKIAKITHSICRRPNLIYSACESIVLACEPNPLESSPVITANWLAAPGQEWTVP